MEKRFEKFKAAEDAERAEIAAARPPERPRLRMMAYGGICFGMITMAAAAHMIRAEQAHMDATALAAEAVAVEDAQAPAEAAAFDGMVFVKPFTSR